jgi:hypothetical protein
MLSIHEDPALADSIRKEAAVTVAKRGLWLPNMERAELEFRRLIEGGAAQR